MNCLSRSGLVAVVAPLLILASAAGGCTHSLDSATDDKSDNYHPKGWVSQHGMAFLTEPAFCTNCHRGLDELAGGPAGTAKRAVEAAAGIPDCNSCHAEAWKTNCTFCHGGKDNRTGSPPLGVRKESSKAAVGVGAHSMHVERTANHAAVDCAICHGTRYQSYADTGHLKNGLPSATVSFTGVAGGMSLWEHDGATCSSTYCHGNGLAPGGPVSWNLGETMNCGSCHGFKTSAAKLSGAHAFHIDDEGTGCSSCHSKVVDSADAIANADLHVNGAINVDIAGGSYDVDKKTCTNSCHSGGSPGWDSGGYHPDGWTEPDEHGFAFLNDTSFCKKCHGDDLAGGKSHVSCDKCHNGGKAWRTNCVFCHGGKDNGTGAPPIGVRGETARSATGVGAHTKHAADTDNHAAYNCAVCHGTKPASIDDTGHIDPGVPPATVKFTGISGTSAAWTHSSANCNSLYCHGNGRAPSGQVSWLSTTQLDCSSCHAFKGDPSGLSGKHEKHVKDKGYGCEKCHAADVNASDKITDKKLHVNGVADVSVPGGTWNGTDKTCTNACHIGGSGNWINGDFHPAGWSDKTKHGYSFYQDISNCKACHGADLKGGTSGISCDLCHTGGGAWRTNCVFCHGGTDNTTGAPPLGVRGETARTSQQVGAHTMHVQATSKHVAWGCAMCHGQTFTSFDDPGHIPAGQPYATVQFTGISGGSAAWTHATGNCSSLYCHGNGQTPSGNMQWTSTTGLNCTSCHAYKTNTSNLSGAHKYHVTTLGKGCSECHSTVVDQFDQIIGLALHVNGVKDVSVPGASYSTADKTCTGSCHAAKSKNWYDKAHPAGWADPANHGYTFLADMPLCRTCHGNDLKGGTSMISCDSCHTGGAAWRTNCVFCHGGTDNTTGAPPKGVHGETATTTAKVGWHTPHVATTATHNAYGCEVCHPKPTAFDTPGHIDTTGGAEMTFTFPSGTPTYASASCNAVYCHGNGRTASGSVSWTTDIAVTCETCHPKGGLGGHHGNGNHVNRTCNTCHNTVVNSSNTVINKALHINQVKNVAMSNGGTYYSGNKTCSSTCHGTSEGSW